MKSPSGGSGGWGKRTSGKPGDVWVGGAIQPGVGLWPTAATQQGGGLGEVWRVAIAGEGRSTVRTRFPLGRGALRALAGALALRSLVPGN